MINERQTVSDLRAQVETLRRRLARLEHAETERQKTENALQASQARFRRLVEQMPAILWTTDVNLVVTMSVGGGLAGLGLVPDQLVGTTVQEYVGTTDLNEEPLAIHMRALRGESISALIYFQDRVLDSHLEPLTDDDGQITGLIGVCFDVTERKHAEDRLRNQYQGIPVPTYTWQKTDAGFKLIDWNEAAEVITKGRIRSLAGTDADELYAGAPDIPSHMARCYNEKSIVRKQMRYSLKTTGEEKDLSVTYVYLPPDLVMIHTEDVSERVQAEAALREAHERLLTLSRRLIEVQELERRHVATELHDEIGQSLTGLGMMLELMRDSVLKSGKPSLARAREIVKDLTEKVRDLSLRLRPTMLDDLGLLSALLWHVERYTEQTRISVDFQHDGIDRRLNPRAVETAAFRIVQEALTNVARHAGVQEVIVRVHLDGMTIRVLVEDHGVGFDVDAPRAAPATSGLSGMRERAVLLDGRLWVDSAPGRGTCVTAELPIQGLEERRRNAFDPVVSG